MPAQPEVQRNVVLTAGTATDAHVAALLAAGGAQCYHGAHPGVVAGRVVDAYREHCRTFHPEFLERLDDAAFALLARANHVRSKTLETTIASSRFFVLPDDAIEFERTKAVRKARRVRAKVNPIASFMGIWMMPSTSYSTGSSAVSNLASMVLIFRRAE